MQRGGVVYIMCSPNRTTLYISVTANLYDRIYEHRNKHYPDSFTAKYNCVMLVYYTPYERIEEAIVAEKKLKDRNRKYKEKLIDSFNPDWRDLWEDLT